MPARRVVLQSRAAGPPPLPPEQIRRDATFIEKHVRPGIVDRQPRPPPAPFSGDVGPPLFVGVNRFFGS